MKKSNNSVGEGYQARIAVVAKATVEVDGKKQTFNIDYDIKMTFEQVDYAVRLIAGRIAQVANEVANGRLSKKAAA